MHTIECHLAIEMKVFTAPFTLGVCISIVWLEGQPQARTWKTSKLLWENGGK